MKIVLTIALQQDNGAAVITGTQTKTSFTSADFEAVRSFVTGQGVNSLVRMMGWIADGDFSVSGTPTVTISQL